MSTHYPASLNHVVPLGELQSTEVRDFLRRPDANLAYIRRDAPKEAHALSQSVAALEEPFQYWFYNRDVSELPSDLGGSLDPFRNGAAKAAVYLEAEVIQLSNLLVAATGDRQPFVSLRTIDADYFATGQPSVSSHMHLDTATVTLTCSYVGGGPQWTPNSNVIREAFADRKMQQLDWPLSKVIRDTNLIYNSELFEVQVLKGEIRTHEDESSLEFLLNFLPQDEIAPFNEGSGLLHRGPGITMGRRLVLTVSSMRTPK